MIKKKVPINEKKSTRVFDFKKTDRFEEIDQISKYLLLFIFL